jgi:spermidine synthase
VSPPARAITTLNHYRGLRAALLALFFISGALGLVYQVAWTRLMQHVFGSTALAVGTVLAGFMAGLALGAWVGGRRADRSSNALRFYAGLEFGIAAAALLSHGLLRELDAAYAALHGLLGGSTILLGMLRFLLAFALIMAPTALMGATLPALTRFLAETPGRVGVQLSSLYAVNAFGAVCGVLLTGFYLLGRYGLHTPVILAAGGNLAVGAAAWLLSARLQPTGSRAPPACQERATTPHGPWIQRAVLAGLAVSGFTSFAYEIYWTRALVFVLGNSTYALSTMLAAFLTGIALGGYLVRFLIRRITDRVLAFGWLQVLLGLCAALALPLLFDLYQPGSVGQWLVRSTDHPVALVLSAFGIAFAVMLVPATLIGATFPLVGDLLVAEKRRAGTTVGKVYALNTIGNVLGALAPGLFLIAWLGIQRGVMAMAILNIVVGFAVLYLCLWPTPGAQGRGWRIALPVCLALTLIAVASLPAGFRFPSEGESARDQILFYREGPLATTKVFRSLTNGDKHISVDGIIIGGTGNAEFKQLLLAHLPKLLMDEVSPELSVGLGSGILAGESLRHDGRVHAMTAVEIEPSVIEGARLFEAENHGVLDDPRIRVVQDDAGHFLRTTTEHYRVVSADEKTADEYASNGFSYSRDYYLLLLARLRQEGLVAQWVPTTLPPRQYRMILKTFAGVFPHVQLWYFLPARERGPFNTVLIGAHQPIVLDADRIEARFAMQPEAYSALQLYGITSADALLPHFIAADETLRGAVADAEVNSLDHPRYEFYTPWDYARDREQRWLENHDLLIALKRAGYPYLLAKQSRDAKARARLRRSLIAEERYLDGFRRFLGGLPLAETYRVFDGALAAAPWNDSLRARIYAQYAFLAQTRADPAERRLLMRRAEALYREQN